MKSQTLLIHRTSHNLAYPIGRYHCLCGVEQYYTFPDTEIGIFKCRVCKTVHGIKSDEFNPDTLSHTFYFSPRFFKCSTRFFK